MTRKYHFPLPFIDQLLERILGHPFYCFWMAIQATSRSRSQQRTKKRLPSPVHLGLMLTGGCLSVYAMPLPHSRDACSVFSAIWWSALWRSIWTTSQYMGVVLKNA